MAAAQRFGTTWWGRAWVDALEHAGGSYESRLPRGRTYARKGHVHELEIHPGHIAARVVGSHGELYRVDIAVRQLADSEWVQVAEAIAGRGAHLAALLDGELHPGVVADAAEVDVSVLPTASDLRPDCECPDWAEPCKHAGAVCYVVAAELDRDPSVLFLLRGRTREELIAAVRSARRRADGSGVDDDAPPTVEAPAEGVDATGIWHGRSLDEPLPPVPAAVTASSAGLRSLRSRPAPWDAEVPRRLGIDPARIDELAEDAVDRARAMLLDGADSGLRAPALADLARHAARWPDAAVDMAARAGLTPGRLRALAEAWRLGGPVAVAVLASPEDWVSDQVLLGSARDRLVEAGHDRRSIALNYDSLRMRSTTWLVLGPDLRWYRLQGTAKHDDLRLVASPAADVVDLVDPVGTD